MANGENSILQKSKTLKIEIMRLNSKFKTQRLMALIVHLIFSSNALVFYGNTNSHNFTFIYRDYLRNMIDIMDHEVQPCMNFYQHACGNIENYEKHMSDGSESDSDSEQQDEFAFSETADVVPFLYNKQDYYTFFERHKQEFDTIPGILVRNVYDLCKNSGHQTSSKRKLWLHMIHDIPFFEHDRNMLRKWPFLQYQWEKYEPEMDLTWPALAAEFSAHGLNTILNVFFAENTIYVAPHDELQCPDLNDIRASLLPLLRKRNAQIADICATEIWVLCRQLKGEIAISEEIDQIKNLLTDDKMSEFFQRFFPRLNFTDSEIEKSRKIVIYIDKLSEIMSLLRATNPRIVFNFILWQAYEQISSADDCFQLVHEFEHLLQVEYWNWYAFESHFRRDVAMASYLFHTTRFQKQYRQYVTSTSWERLFQQRSERKDLNIERSIKNYAKQFLNVENYSAVFRPDLFSLENPKYYDHLLQLRRLKIRHTFLNPYEDTEGLHFFKEFLNFAILLLYRPRLHYFASYDREMWQNSNVLQSTDGLFAALDCLNHQTDLNADDYKIYENLSVEQVNQIFNFYTSFMEALSDYKFWLESENFAIAEDFILEYFELDSQRVMFYAVAQQFCKRYDPFYGHLINRSFMNMPEFQEAFECQSYEGMNPITKCMVKQCPSD